MSGEDIQYSAILQSTDIVAELDNRSSGEANLDFRSIVISIANQAVSGDVACVTANTLTVYYIKHIRRVIAAVPKDNAPPRIVLGFLREVDAQLKARLEEPSTSESLTILKASYEKIKKKRDSLTITRSEIDKVKKIMVENIDQLLERGERINLLVDRTGEMSNSANIFNRQATQLQRKMWFQNIKVILIGFALVTVSTMAVVKAFN